LFVAAANGYKGNVELFLADHVDPDQRDNKGETPLHIAEANGHTEIANLLRQSGGHY